MDYVGTYAQSHRIATPTHTRMRQSDTVYLLRAQLMLNSLQQLMRKRIGSAGTEYYVAVLRDLLWLELRCPRLTPSRRRPFLLVAPVRSSLREEAATRRAAAIRAPPAQCVASHCDALGDRADSGLVATILLALPLPQSQIICKRRRFALPAADGFHSQREAGAQDIAKAR